MRKVCYITGTRADFGLMQETLLAIHHSPQLSLSILVTGVHLDKRYGETIKDIERAGLPILACVKAESTDTTGAGMARGIGEMTSGFVNELQKAKPDILLLLGDRGEMLAGAIAAIHLNIPIAHIHGGELSGTVDEPVRHAISKLSHYHFTSTENAKNRLVKMGEYPNKIFVTGAPGLVGLETLDTFSRKELAAELNLNDTDRIALLLYHPVLQEADKAGDVIRTILNALRQQKCQVVALMPNADAGSHEVRRVLEAKKNDVNFRLITHFEREKFLSWMAAVEFMIGNSSAGIIEAATFGTPVINVGTRQNMRERNANVIDVVEDELTISKGIQKALAHKRYGKNNIYGDGKTHIRIAELLKNLPLDITVLNKTNAY